MRSSSYLVATSTAALLSWGGCAASHPPTQLWLQTQQALKQASENGAEEYAPLALHTAQEKLETSQRAVKKNHPKKAQRLAEEALVDAELAEVTSRAAKAQKASEQIRQGIDALQQETQAK